MNVLSRLGHEFQTRTRGRRRGHNILPVQEGSDTRPGVEWLASQQILASMLRVSSGWLVPAHPLTRWNLFFVAIAAFHGIRAKHPSPVKKKNVGGERAEKNVAFSHSCKKGPSW